MSLFGSAASDITIAIIAKDQASKVLEGVKEKTASTFGENAGVAKYAKAAAVGVAGVATAAAAGVTALFAMANSVSKTGDEFQKMSLRTGVSAKNLSTLKFAADRSGSSLGAVENGLRRLAANALDTSRGTGAAKDAFADLGVEVKDSNGILKRSDDLMMELADRFMNLEDDTKAAALAQQIFGKSGTALLPLLKEGSDGIRDLQGRAKELGLEFSSTAANDSAAFQDALTDLNSAFSGITQSVALAVIPTFTSLLNTFTDGVLWAKNFKDELAGLKKGVDVSAELKALADLGISFNTEVLDINARIGELETARIKLGSEINTSRQALRREGEGIVKDAEDAQARLDTLNNTLAENYKELISLREKDSKWVGIGTSSAGAQATALENLIDKQTATAEKLNTMVTAYNSQKTVQEEIQKLEFEKTMAATSAAIDVVADKVKAFPEPPPSFRNMVGVIGEANTAYAGLIVKLEEKPEFPTISIEERLGLTATEIENLEDTGSIYGEKLGKGIEKGTKDGFLAGFERNFQSALEMSLGNLIRTGDFVGALKRFGENMLDGIVGGLAKNTSQKITDALFGGEGGGFGLTSIFKSKGAEGGSAGGAAAGAAFNLSFTAALQAGVTVASAAFAASVTKGIAENVADASWTASPNQWAFSQTDEQLAAYMGGIGQDPEKNAAAKAELDRREGLRTQTQTQAQAQSDARVSGIIQGAMDRMVDARKEGRSNLTHDEFIKITGFVGGEGGRELAVEALSRSDSDADALEYFVSRVTSRMSDSSAPTPSPVVSAPAPDPVSAVGTEMEKRVNAVILGVQARAQSATEEGRLNLTFGEWDGMARFVGGLDGDRLAREALSWTTSTQRDDWAAIEYFIGSLTRQLRIPGFQIGGTVPGPIGRPQLVMAHGGEAFTPRGRGFVGGARSGATIVNYFQTVVQTPDADGMRRLIDGEFGDLMMSRIFRESAGANPVVHDRGIFSPPVV